MNRDRARELLPIIEAFANGEEIEFRLANLEHTVHHKDPIDWCDLPKDEGLMLTFPCDDYEYRIKPKAREVYVVWDDRHGGPEDAYTALKKDLHIWQHHAVFREVL